MIQIESFDVGHDITWDYVGDQEYELEIPDRWHLEVDNPSWFLCLVCEDAEAKPDVIHNVEVEDIFILELDFEVQGWYYKGKTKGRPEDCYPGDGRELRWPTRFSLYHLKPDQKLAHHIPTSLEALEELFAFNKNEVDKQDVVLTSTAAAPF
jgi:hypothetical protein